jgi:hypothetical protein
MSDDRLLIHPLCFAYAHNKVVEDEIEIRKRFVSIVLVCGLRYIWLFPIFHAALQVVIRSVLLKAWSTRLSMPHSTNVPKPTQVEFIPTEWLWVLRDFRQPKFKITKLTTTRCAIERFYDSNTKENYHFLKMAVMYVERAYVDFVRRLSGQGRIVYSFFVKSTTGTTWA